MIKPCPNPSCTYYQQTDSILRDGSYFRACDSKVIQRFRCRHCGKRFSAARYSEEYRQKKRRINPNLKRLLASGVSLRRSALFLGVSRPTIHRHFLFLAKKARNSQEFFLESLRSTPVENVQFDDLITIEHTKMKPLTISIAVDSSTRAILGAEVGRIPAFGHLAKKSRDKYGPRPSEHWRTLVRLFKHVQPAINGKATFKSDEHVLYPKILKKYFKHGTHKKFKGGRACVAGQGELKKQHYDPLFVINHTCAMFRANINRLIRKTWCTSKKTEYLKAHLDIFIDYYNREYLKIEINDPCK